MLVSDCFWVMIKGGQTYSSEWSGLDFSCSELRSSWLILKLCLTVFVSSIWSRSIYSYSAVVSSILNEVYFEILFAAVLSLNIVVTLFLRVVYSAWDPWIKSPMFWKCLYFCWFDSSTLSFLALNFFGVNFVGKSPGPVLSYECGVWGRKPSLL